MTHNRFSIGYPQLTDAKGGLANDGAIVDVRFRKGEFDTDERSQHPSPAVFYSESIPPPITTLHDIAISQR